MVVQKKNQGLFHSSHRQGNQTESSRGRFRPYHGPKKEQKPESSVIGYKIFLSLIHLFVKRRDNAHLLTHILNQLCNHRLQCCNFTPSMFLLIFKPLVPPGGWCYARLHWIQKRCFFFMLLFDHNIICSIWVFFLLIGCLSQIRSLNSIINRE